MSDEPLEERTRPAVLFPVPVGRLAWHDRAACRGLTTADHDRLFFPGRAQNMAKAKLICSTCPVRLQCLDFALEHNERHGVWGGTSPYERRVMRAERLRDEGAA